MKFGLAIPNWAPFTQQLMIELAIEAEGLGFDHVFYTDHLMSPYAAAEGLSQDTVETWSLLSHLAAKTSTIRLGTSVTPITLRPPGLLAKQVATADNLSGGRIDVGIGTGWSSGSYGVIDSDFGSPTSRKERLHEGVDLLTRLWTEDSVTFDGKYFQAKDAVIFPKPVQQPHPPIWFGGWRNAILDVTARKGNGWLPWNRSLEHWTDRRSALHAHAAELGRADEIQYGTVMLVVPDRMRDQPLALVRNDPPHLTPRDLEASVAGFADAGASMFAVFPFPADDALEIVRGFARQFL
jgi:probable F420-dependent oxidoreductase